MDNREKLATLDTQETGRIQNKPKQNKTTQETKISEQHRTTKNKGDPGSAPL